MFSLSGIALGLIVLGMGIRAGKLSSPDFLDKRGTLF